MENPKQRHEGFSNVHTWSVVLLLNSSRIAYEKVRKAMKESKSIREFAICLCLESLHWISHDLTYQDLKYINWVEIAESFFNDSEFGTVQVVERKRLSS